MYFENGHFLLQITLCMIIQKILPDPNLKPAIISGSCLSRRFMLAIQTDSSRIKMVFMRHLFVCKRHGQILALRFLINRNPGAIANAIRRKPSAFLNLLRCKVLSALSWIARLNFWTFIFSLEVSIIDEYTVEMDFNTQNYLERIPALQGILKQTENFVKEIPFPITIQLQEKSWSRKFRLQVSKVQKFPPLIVIPLDNRHPWIYICSEQVCSLVFFACRREGV